MGFCKMVENQFGTHVKSIRSDNGLEFSMSDFFSQEGILHQTSCTYTPQQNSRVERKHGHLLSIARALRFQAHLPERFWGESGLSDDQQEQHHIVSPEHAPEQSQSPILGEMSEYIPEQSPEQPPQQPAVRRSTRQKHTPAYLGDYVCHTSTIRTSPHDISRVTRPDLPRRRIVRSFFYGGEEGARIADLQGVDGGCAAMGGMKLTGVSMRYMMEFGSRPMDRNLLISSQFLHKELPIRIVRLAIDLQNLPYGLSLKPVVLKVRNFTLSIPIIYIVDLLCVVSSDQT
nr:Retrovirus-related Pol polyprotein from transposon TNT 1-94 [Ipomoea batatas]